MSPALRSPASVAGTGVTTERGHTCVNSLCWPTRGRSMVALEGASPRWCPEAVWEGGRRARGLERPRPAQEWDGGWTWRVGRLCGARTGVGFTGKGRRDVGRFHRGREGGGARLGRGTFSAHLPRASLWQVQTSPSPGTAGPLTAPRRSENPKWPKVTQLVSGSDKI